jgi:glycosyltransferase involved in cell wall biosynthesis
MHILRDLSIAGTQRVVTGLLTNLDRSRFRPMICTLEGGGPLLSRLDEARVPHHLTYFPGPLSMTGLWRLRNLLVEREVDIVHTHEAGPNLSGRLAAVLAGTPVIIAHAHDLHRGRHPLQRWVDGWLAVRTDRFLCVSEAVASVQAELTGLSRERFTTLYNLLDPAAFQSDVSGQLARADIGVPADAPCVGCLGRLVAEKRHDLFLEAAYRLNQRRPEIHFLIAGEGPELPRLRELTRSMGMTHKVSFTGFHPEVARLYRALDCLVLTSDSEGLGMVLLEAQAAGVPVVARAVGGVPEALALGGGLLVNDPSPEAIAGTIEAALEPDRTRMLREQMHANLQRFDAGRQVTQLEDLYEETCRAKGLGEPAVA